MVVSEDDTAPYRCRSISELPPERRGHAPAYSSEPLPDVRFRTLLGELPPVKEPLIQSMINVRFRNLLEELQGNATALQGNQTALVERDSTTEEFLLPRMVVDVRCH